MTGERMESQTTMPERFGSLARLPLFFALQGKRAVIAGGSPAAAWKVELLSAAGARVDVYAVDACSELSQLAAGRPAGNVILHRRAWTAADLPGATIAVGDLRDDGEAAAFAAAARAAGVPVNVIDQPAHCDFSFGAIVNRSPLVIGISTDGAAPVFARAIRGRLEALLPQGFARWTAAAARWRSALRASTLSFADRRSFWELFTAHAMAHAGDEPGRTDFARFIAKAKGSMGSGLDRGAVTVVDVDGNDPDALTLRAVRALHAADVILFDERVSHQILDFARREAKKIRVGKTGRDVETEALLAELRKQGARVVQLTSRDYRDAAHVLKQRSRRTAPRLVPDDEIMTVN
jgi:uroporphyrin-III C-methyltransferase / precorrin-2 dehydrogenase / sirohydrochlorin ferrochelatase